MHNGCTPKINGIHDQETKLPNGLTKLPPLISAMKEISEHDNTSFQFPGHNRGRAAPSSLTQLIGHAPYLHDNEVFDNLLSDGPLAEAQKQAAEVFGALETRFLVGGTTSGVHAAILGTCSPGDVLIVSRNCHQSVISGMVLTGVEPKYVFPDYDPGWDIATTVSLSQVENAINELSSDGKKPAAVFITSPTYHGICSDINEISTICHTHNIPLIVDEAHGAHFGFHPNLPTSALSQGADIVLQSTHKVLLAFTQASMLHLQGNLINRDNIRKSLHALQSTSPNSLLLASLDASTEQLRKNPASLFQNMIDLAGEARIRIREIPGMSLLELDPDMDPLRVTIGLFELDVSGFEAEEYLRRDSMIISCLAGLRWITLLFTPGTGQDDVDRLLVGLNRLSSSCGLIYPKKTRKCEFLSDVDIRMTPREAFFKKKLRVGIEESVGRVSGEVVCPFPPGIPVLIPGEVVTEKALRILLQCKVEGGRVVGASDVLLSSILVCD